MDRTHHSNVNRRVSLLKTVRGLLQVLLVITGMLVVLLGAEYTTPTSTAGALLSAVGTAVVAAGVVDMTWDWIGRRAERAETNETIRRAVIAGLRADELNIESAALEHIDSLDMENLSQRTRTLHMVLLYDPMWPELLSENFLRRFLLQRRNTLHVYTPAATEIDVLAERHQMSSTNFVAKVEDLIHHIRSLTERPESLATVRFFEVPLPGPAYSGYYFDPIRWDGKKRHGAAPGARSVMRIYRHVMTQGEPLLTFVFGEGAATNRIHDDFAMLFERAATPQSGPRVIQAGRPRESLEEASGPAPASQAQVSDGLAPSIAPRTANGDAPIS